MADEAEPYGPVFDRVAEFEGPGERIPLASLVVAWYVDEEGKTRAWWKVDGLLQDREALGTLEQIKYVYLKAADESDAD